MINSLPHLKTHGSQLALLNKIKSQFPNGNIIRLNTQARYLSVDLTETSGLDKISGLIDLDDFLDNIECQLPGIPWVEVPIKYIISWIKDRHVDFFIGDKIWYITDLKTVTLAQHEYLLSVPAKPSEILFNTWIESKVTYSKNCHLLLDIPFMLRYMLGSSYVSLQDLVAINNGDLIQIHDISFGVDIENYRVFSFNYSGKDEIVVNEQIMEYRDQQRNEESLLLDWRKLPVHVEFMLDSKLLKLEELDSLEVGTALKLSDKVEKNIKVYLNRVLFAQGELVLLEEGGLAVEINNIVAQQEPLPGSHNA